MSNFVQATEYEVYKHAKFRDFNFYIFLQLNTPRFDL
jgi:hypothetical protein